MRELRATRALISGGANGIGLAIAEALAKEGVELVLASRRLPLLEREAERLSARYGVRVLPLALNVSDSGQVRAQHAQARERLGPINLLINNSGVGSDYLVQDLPESEWDRVMDTCAKGSFLLTQACLPDMLARQHGTIINIASQAAKHGYARATSTVPPSSPYWASPRRCAKRCRVRGSGFIPSAPASYRCRLRPVPPSANPAGYRSRIWPRLYTPRIRISKDLFPRERRYD